MLKYSEAIELIDDMLKSNRERAGMNSHAFDSGVLMGALASLMVTEPEVERYIRNQIKVK